jgi:hypothetical protein
MKIRVAKYGLIILLIACIILICGCLGAKSGTLPSNKYVAVYEEKTDGGTIVSGYYPYPIYPGGPMGYMKPFFYKQSDYPSGGFPYSMNDSTKLLLGVLYIQGSSSVYISSNLSVLEIYDLPYMLEPGLTITGIDKNGTVEMSYDNVSINLPPGSAWNSPVIATWNETDIVKYPPPDWATGEDHGTNYTYTVQYTRIWAIENKGIYDK